MLKYNRGNYYEDSYSKCESLNFLYGEQVCDFSCDLIPNIVIILKSRFTQSKLVINLWNFLQVCKRITKFMSMTASFAFNDDKITILRKKKHNMKGILKQLCQIYIFLLI